MKRISQRMIWEGEASNIAIRVADGYHAQTADGISGLEKQPVPHPYDPLMDIESVRLMEERYGIKEEGLF